MSPWVRIDENALEHPKIGALPDGAFRLWVQGLAYCQKFLTDGFISDLAIRGLHSFSPKRKGLLVNAGLWDLSEAGIRVHDFLEWNDSREHVVAARQFAKDRMKRLRDKRSREQTPNSQPRDAERSLNVPSGVVCMSSGSEVKERGLGETVEVRAGDFCQWYEDTHERLFGVGYIGTQRDYQSAVQLCQKLSDQQVRDAALVWFGMDDDFAVSGTRTIPKFASRATGCLQQALARGIA
jgi:hypothetical protein